MDLMICNICFTQIITLPGLWTSHTTFPKTWSPLKNPFTPTVLSSATNMASPSPLQFAHPMVYVDDFGFPPENQNRFNRKLKSSFMKILKYYTRTNIHKNL